MIKCFLILCILIQSCFGQIEELKTFQKLNKIHHSWPVYDEQLLNPTPEFREVIRICGSVPIGLNSDEAIKAAANLAKELKIQVAVNFSPWSNTRCPNLIATPGNITQWNEVAYWANSLSKIKTLLGDNVKVGAVLIDDERWVDQPEVMLPYRKALHEISKELFSDAFIVWYAYGAIMPDASSTGWSNGTSIFGGLKLTDIHSVPLYCLSQEYRTQESYRRTVIASNGNPVIPWIALNAGYEPKVDRFHSWNYNWDYGLIWSNKFGAQINQNWYSANEDRRLRYAPWNKAPFVIFYPSCTSGSPNKNVSTKWVQYFVAYCRGAFGINNIEGL